MVQAETAYYRFAGSARELSLTLFGEEPVELLGGMPVACEAPEAGSIVDISLPTYAGVNPARIHARALVQRLDRMLGEGGANLFAVRGPFLPSAPGKLGADESAGLAAAEEAFFSVLCAQNDNASTIAHYLACHPLVAEVRYPGIKSDPSFPDAAQLLAHGFGNAVDFCLESDAEFKRVSATAGDPFDQIEALEAALAERS